MAASSTSFVVHTLGASAASCLSGQQAQCGRGEVLAVFKRCCYVQLAEGTLCIGDQSLLPGPVNVLLETQQWQQLSTDMRAGDRVFNEASALSFAANQCDWSNARISDDALPPAVWADGARQACISAMSDAINVLCTVAPTDSLAALIPAWRKSKIVPAGVGLEVELIRFIGPIVDLFFTELLARIRANAAGKSAPTNEFAVASHAQRLLGAGAGLTPAADDLLAGVLLAMNFLGLSRQAGELMQVLQPELASCTNRVSATLLQQSAKGLTGQSLLALFVELNKMAGSAAIDVARPDAHCAIYQTMPAAAAGSVATIDIDLCASLLHAQGHTSGWDCLAGIALFIDALLVDAALLNQHNETVC